MTIDFKRLFALFALATALIATGCGGDDDDDSGNRNGNGGDDAGAATLEEYDEQLPGILIPLGEELQEIGAVTQESTSNEEVAANVENAIGTLQSGIDELSAIDPPEEIADAHASMISSIESFKGSAEEFASLAAEGDEAAVQAGVVDFQASVGTFQTDFQGAIAELQEAGVGTEPSEGG